MEQRHLSEEYTEMAEELIDNLPELQKLKNADVDIGYLVSDKAKKSHGRLVFGECEKVQDKNKWSIPFDFLIIIYDRNCTGMTEEQLRILLYHELLHVGVEETDGETRFYVRPHDTQDFREILEKYGYDWDRIDAQF